MTKKTGWFNKNKLGYSVKHESHRHSLASRGIKTNAPKGTKGFSSVGSPTPNFDMVEKGKGLPDIDLWKHNWTFRLEKGKIEVSLGNLTTAGWYWDGDEKDLVGYLNRIRTSDVKKEFLSEMKKAGVPFSKLKEFLLKSVKEADGLYEISGDNARWHFGQDSEIEYEELEQRVRDGEIPKDKKDEVLNKFYDIYESETYDFDKWSKGEKKDYVKNMTDAIKKSQSYEDFFEKIESIEENIREGLNSSEQTEIFCAMNEAQEQVLNKKTDMVSGEKKWKNTSKTFSDGSKSIEWRSKDKKVSINYWDGWNVAVTSLRKGELSQLMADTGHTKKEAFKIAREYMKSNPKG